MNIQQMMKQAQQMQERLQKQMAELRVEGNAGGGMVTVVVNGAKQVQSLKIDPEVVSKDDVEMLQDLIVAADQRRAAQGRRRDGAEDGRHAAAGHEAAGHVNCRSRCRFLIRSLRLIEELQRLPGIGPKGAQRLAFHILKTPREQADRLVDAVRDVKERVTYCSVCNNITDADPCAYCSSDDRDHHDHLRRRGAAERRGDREDARVQGRLSRADGRAVAAAGHRSRRSEDQGPAGARRRRRRPKSSSPPIPTSKAKRRRSIWRGCSSRSASR